MLKQKEDMILINEEELANLKNKNNEIKNSVNTKIKNIEDIYQKKFEEEINKSKTYLINSIREKLDETINKYNEKFEGRKTFFDAKFNELNNSILNSKLSLNDEPKKENVNQNLNNINNNIQNINNNNMIRQNLGGEQISNQNNNNIINQNI